MFYIMSSKMLCSWVVHPVDVARATTYLVAHGEEKALKPNSFWFLCAMTGNVIL